MWLWVAASDLIGTCFPKVIECLELNTRKQIECLELNTRKQIDYKGALNENK